VTIYLKKSQYKKRTDEVAQGIELSSNPSTAKKKKKKKKKKRRDHSLFLYAPCSLPNTATICLFLSRSLPSSYTLR
jgi:hypothetical protein